MISTTSVESSGPLFVSGFLVIGYAFEILCLACNLAKVHDNNRMGWIGLARLNPLLSNCPHFVQTVQCGFCCRASCQTVRGCVPNPAYSKRRPETVLTSYIHTIT